MSPSIKRPIKVSSFIISILLSWTLEASSLIPFPTLQKETTQSFLQRFYQHPERVINERPPKFNAKGLPIPDHLFPGIMQEAFQNNFIAEKISFRSHFLAGATKALIESNDLPENLTDNQDNFVRSLTDIDQKGLLAATIPNQPWSDDYWPTRQGLIAYRYADPSSPRDGQAWTVYNEYTNKNPVSSYLESGKVNLLSPAEKYDLLVGNTQGELTAAMWNDGQYFVDRGMDVESWMGICHGWAQASYNLTRPLKAIKVKSFDGKYDILFYPSDIKALGSLLWANAPASIHFISGRCNIKAPPADRFGRVLVDECFDTNPGSWHLSVVNQIGLSKRSFILDATYDYEVWNQPIIRYSYKYFNPQTGKSFKNAQDAMITPQEFTKDLFTKHRGAKTEFIVGVEMDLTYIFESNPYPRLEDNPRHDNIQTVVYRYDLELDKDKNVVGGEWYNNRHPDFLFTPIPGAKARSYYDQSLQGTWNPAEGPIPAQWSSVAKMAAKRELPLALVVEKLFEEAAKR